MSNLYKKILNEVFSVMDFDSWDDTEQSFKEIINKTVNAHIILKIPQEWCINNERGINNAQYSLQIFGIEDINFESDDMLYSCGMVKRIYQYYTEPHGNGLPHPFELASINQNNILINGKVYKLTEDFFTIEKFPAGTYSVSFTCAFTNKMCNNLFQGNIFLREVNHLPITSGATSASCMFNGCIFLESVKSLGDTSNISNMSGLFAYCHYLKTLPAKFDTSHAKDINCMFYDCYKLTEIPEIDTSSVEDMENVFDGCAIKKLHQLSAKSLVSCKEMFIGAFALEYVPVFKDWNLQLIRDIIVTHMFYDGCSRLTPECIREWMQFLNRYRPAYWGGVHMYLEELLKDKT